MRCLHDFVAYNNGQTPQLIMLYKECLEQFAVELWTFMETVSVFVAAIQLVKTNSSKCVTLHSTNSKDIVKKFELASVRFIIVQISVFTNYHVSLIFAGIYLCLFIALFGYILH